MQSSRRLGATRAQPEKANGALLITGASGGLASVWRSCFPARAVGCTKCLAAPSSSNFMTLRLWPATSSRRPRRPGCCIGTPSMQQVLPEIRNLCRPPIADNWSLHQRGGAREADLLGWDVTDDQSSARYRLSSARWPLATGRSPRSRLRSPTQAYRGHRRYQVPGQWSFRRRPLCRTRRPPHRRHNLRQ
jgi:hypothetical protein